MTSQKSDLPPLLWTVYILGCADGTLYTGITNNLERRMAAHTGGTGAKYVRGRLPFEVLYTEACAGKSEALKRELAIKRLGRAEKLRLVAPVPRKTRKWRPAQPEDRS